MITTLRPRRNDSGFTLVELIVVVAIIGVLAAIAVPVYLGQKEKAYESAAQADLKAIATQVELRHAQTGTFPTAKDLHDAGIDISTSPDVKAAVIWVTATDFCVAATSQGGTLDPSGLAQYAGQSKRIFVISGGQGVSAVNAFGDGCIVRDRPYDGNQGWWDSSGYQSSPIW